MAKYVKYIFICFFAVFVMSHNTSAISPVLNLNDYELINSFYATTISCSFTNVINQSPNDTNNYCRAQISGNSGQISTFNSFQTTGTYSVKSGDIVNFQFVVLSETEGFPGDFLLTRYTNQSLGWNLLDVSVVDSGIFNHDQVSNNGVINLNGNNFDINLDYSNMDGFYKVYEFTLIARTDGNLHIGLVGNPIFQYSIDTTNGQIYIVNVGNYKIYRYSGSNVNKEQAEATQDAADDSSNAGSSSESSAEAATSSLISVIVGFVNVITNAQATNCKINMNTTQLQVGEIDLCANPVPSYVQIIGSLILICAVIPLAIILFNRFIGLFRSFQG